MKEKNVAIQGIIRVGGLICFAGMDMAYAEALQDKKDLTRRV